jgi:hypothetical protein
MQIQKGTPRTVVTMDATVGSQYYWEQPGQKEDYTAGLDMSFVHRLSPRATVSFDMSAVYQKAPNYTLINAPTNNNNNSNYLNGSGMLSLNYSWGNRISTVTSYSLGTYLLQSNATNNLYQNTFGNQFRYTVSARNTVTAELRESLGEYPSNASANTAGTFYLLGLDSNISAKLKNTISGGIETYAFTNGGSSQTLPYVESDTTLALPRGAGLTWTNRYGSEQSGAQNLESKSYRTSLSFAQPLSTKLVASVTLAYNYIDTADTLTSAGSYTQNQLQASLSLGYTVTPRFSLSLSYTFNDLLSTQVNSSYVRDQVFLGGTYTFH